MKKSNRFLTGIIALSAIILFSCNNLAGGKVFEKGRGINADGKVTLSVAVDGMYTSAEIPGVSRNIMPVSWDEDGERIRSLKYVLTGSPVGTPFAMTEVPATAWSYDDIKDGNAKIDLDAVEWTLTLTAYQGYTDADNPGVIALQSNPKLVDLSTGATTVSFDLLPPSDTEATGDVNVKITFEMPASFDHVIYGIYAGSLPTSDPVDSTVTSITPITAKVGAGLTEVVTGKYNFEYKTDNDNKVKAGKYSFNATFYAKVDGADKVICFYSDSIQIDGGNLTEKTINISKEAFNAPAVNPTSLAVAYSYNNNDLNPVELTNSTVDGKYLATFTWDDKSDNELGFELVITDVAEAAADPTYEPAKYTAASTLKAGSLSASSETATVELETGKEYSAKIRAVNNFTTTSPVDSDYYSTTERIFLFTVAYNLDHGKIQKDASTSTADSIVTYVVPCTPYTSSPVLPDLITKVADTVVYPYVFRTDYKFLKWYESAPTDEAYTAITVPSAGNIVLTAYWQSELGVTINTPDYSTISDYALVKDYAEAAVYEVDGKTINTVTLTPNNGLTDVEWTIQNYTDSSEIITGKSVDGATKALTWTITGVDAATYRIAVSGTYNGENVTGNIYIKITR